MTIQLALNWAIKKLSARLDAEIILSFVLNQKIVHLYTYPQKNLTSRQLKKFQKLITLRATGVPVAYLINSQSFCSLSFYVDQNVLIPRPETELLVEQTLELVKKNFPKASKLKIADLGTGSGAIAITLARNLKQAKVLATDISLPALKVARRNARNLKVKISFLRGNLLEPLKNKKIDILVANLPYVESGLSLTKPETRGLKFEPKQALFAGLDGLKTFKNFFKQLSELKNLPQFILLEHGAKQAISLKKLIKKTLPKSKVQSLKDLAGRDRVLIIAT